MWDRFEKISDQVRKYSSFLGQLWYFLVFVFRLIVVVTIGAKVYDDEQSAFKCSTDVVGCQNICYNEFAKISHIRFWAFQLLAVATPTAFFHFYSLYVSGEIEKLRNSENQLKSLEEADGRRMLLSAASMSEKDLLKMSRRKKSVGEIKVKRVYSDNVLKEIPYTSKVQCAYYVCAFFRLGFEGLFIYLGYLLFRNMHPDLEIEHSNFLDFLWMEVPAFYTCSGEAGLAVHRACAMHLIDQNSRYRGFVPCFVSRPYEKTVFLRYMSVLSALCFALCLMEIVFLTLKMIWKSTHPRRRQRQKPRAYFHPQHQDSVFFPPTHATAPIRTFEDNRFYPSLAVPLRLPNKNFSKPTARIEEKDAVSTNASVKSYV